MGPRSLSPDTSGSRRRRWRVSRWPSFVAGAGAAWALVALVGSGPRVQEAPRTEAASPVVEAPSRVSRAEEDLRRTPVVRAVEKVAPAVVSITTEVARTDPFFGTRRTESSEGSGVVISADGVILTNNHVIAGATRILASFATGSTVAVDLVGTAPELDLAVLRIPAASIDQPLTSVDVGSSHQLLLGEPVIAIGNPFGLGHTVTTGVVSAVSRSIKTDEHVYQDFIQTDASINPGNSGGPLLDVTGRLIGINTAIRPDAEGIGFAIPVDRAVKVARDLIQYGTVQIPWLGVDLDDVALRTTDGRRIAVQVSRVFPESPAQRAGLQVGDILLKVDGREINGRSDLNAHLAAFAPEHTVSVEGLRRGAGFAQQVTPINLPSAVVDRVLADVLGVRIIDSPDGRAVSLQSLDPNGAMARRGLQAGDRILAVNGTPTKDSTTLRKTLAHIKSGHRGSALFLIQRRDIVASISAPI